MKQEKKPYNQPEKNPKTPGQPQHPQQPKQPPQQGNPNEWQKKGNR